MRSLIAPPARWLVRWLRARSSFAWRSDRPGLAFVTNWAAHVVARTAGIIGHDQPLPVDDNEI